MHPRLNLSRQLLTVLAIALNILLIVGGAALYLVRQGQPGLWAAVGEGLITTGLAALVLTTYSILEARVTAKEDNIDSQARRLGLVAYFDGRPTFRPHPGQYSFRDAKRIDILELTAHSIFPVSDVDAWMKWCPRANVRILLLHPLWPPGTWTFADQRDYEEQHGPHTDLQQINDFIKKFGRRFSLPGGGSFEVRLTRTMPTISYFRIDDNAYWAPYLINEYGHSVPHLEISSSGELFEWLATNFKRLWKDADSDLIPLPVDDVVELRREWAARAPLSVFPGNASNARPPETRSPSRQRAPKSRDGQQ